MYEICLHTYIPFGINGMYNADTSEINVLGTSEMNVRNASKVTTLLLLWVFFHTLCTSNMIFLLNWILLNLLLLPLTLK